MNRLSKVSDQRERRKLRVRKTVVGSTERPRLSVKVSNSNVTAQIIDDSKGETIVSATSIGAKSLDKKPLSEKAKWVGEQVAEKAKKAKVKKVVYDRNSRLYHGRVKALADAAREKGLEF